MQSYLVSIVSKNIKDNFNNLHIKPHNRSLLYIPEERNLYILINNNLNLIGNIDTDNINIGINENGELYLIDDVSLKSLLVSPDENSALLTEYLGMTSLNKNVVLLTDKNTKSVLSGNLIRNGDNVEAYHLHITSDGHGTLSGASALAEKAKLVKVTFNNQIYYGIKFLTTADSVIHFEGFDDRQDKTFSFIDFTDNDIQIEEI